MADRDEVSADGEWPAPLPEVTPQPAPSSAAPRDERASVYTLGDGSRWLHANGEAERVAPPGTDHHEVRWRHRGLPAMDLACAERRRSTLTPGRTLTGTASGIGPCRSLLATRTQTTSPSSPRTRGSRARRCRQDRTQARRGRRVWLLNFSGTPGETHSPGERRMSAWNTSAREVGTVTPRVVRTAESRRDRERYEVGAYRIIYERRDLKPVRVVAIRHRGQAYDTDPR